MITLSNIVLKCEHPPGLHPAEAAERGERFVLTWSQQVASGHAWTNQSHCLGPEGRALVKGDTPGCALFIAGRQPYVLVEHEPVTADNGSLPEGRYFVCFEGDTNGAVLCESREHLSTFLNECFLMSEGGALIIDHALNPRNWNDPDEDLHYERDISAFKPHQFTLHIWREQEMTS